MSVVFRVCGNLQTSDVYDGLVRIFAKTIDGKNFEVFLSQNSLKQDCFVLESPDSVAFILGRTIDTDAAVNSTAFDAISRDDASKLSELGGSFCGAIFSSKSLQFISDISGCHVLYWYETNGEIWLSSSAILLAKLFKLLPSMTFLAVKMLYPGVSPLITRHAPFEKLNCLPPASLLKWKRDDCQPSIIPYWSPFEKKMSLNEGMPAFQVELTKSVEARAQKSGILGSDLSGGMDSSVICAIASNALESSQKILSTFTFGTFDAKETSDAEHAKIFLSKYKNINGVFLTPGEEHQFLCSLDCLPPTDYQSFDLGRFKLYEQRLQSAKSLGCDMLLSGHGADCYVTSTPALLSDLWRNKKFSKFYSSCRDLSTYYNVPLLTLAFKTIRDSTVPNFKKLHTKILQDTVPKKENFSLSSKVLSDFTARYAVRSPDAWITDKACQLAQTALEVSASSLFFTKNSGDHVCLNDLWCTANNHRVQMQQAEAHGYMIETPYFDSNVVKSALNVADEDRTDPKIYKPLQNLAFANLLPREIAERGSTTSYSSFIYAGFEKNIATLVSMMQDSHLHKMGLIDSNKVHKAILEVTAGASLYSIVQLAQIILTEAWLRGFHVWTLKDILNPIDGAQKQELKMSLRHHFVKEI